jgi:hypothetical protein
VAAAQTGMGRLQARVLRGVTLARGLGHPLGEDLLRLAGQQGMGRVLGMGEDRLVQSLHVRGHPRVVVGVSPLGERGCGLLRWGGVQCLPMRTVGAVAPGSAGTGRLHRRSRAGSRGFLVLGDFRLGPLLLTGRQGCGVVPRCGRGRACAVCRGQSL